jgi:hypothetical protein
LGWTIQGRTGLLAAAFATCVCLFACHLALVVTTLMVPPSRAAAHLLSGMMIRMSVPLLASLFVVEQQRDWISAGYGWFVVGAFLLGLTAETLFTVGHLQALTAKSPKSESGNGPPSSAAMSPLHPST